MSSIAAPADRVALPRHVLYPERPPRREGKLDQMAVALSGRMFAPMMRLRTARLSRLVSLVAEHGDGMARLDDTGLQRCVRELRAELRARPSFEDAVVARSFALIREAAGRVLGQRHFDVQLVGGLAMLRGMVAEMQTGEGKTLTATLAAGTAAIAGIPVHVITVNDYLAGRDAEWMGPLYRLLGLTVGVVVQGRPPDQRRAAYACDITYCTNKELAFDYLRDRMRLGRRSGNLQLKLDGLYGAAGRSESLLLRGLHFAIVDEADSVLIDEARTPLVISGKTDSPAEAETFAQALALVRKLDDGSDYRIIVDERRVALTEAGKDRLRELAEPLAGPWRGRVLREQLASQALTALNLFRRDEHYLVQDGRVLIVDEYTGRIMPDRFWSEGLHQMIELKEGCEPTGSRTTLGRMTYQRFFRRYQRLAGMTGTAREVAHELWTVYRLPVTQIPTNRPARARRLTDRVLPTTEQKWRAIGDRVSALHRRGCPMLLGTRSVAASEQASAELGAAGLPHVVLNAAQDSNEAEIIANAGQRGRITIATNMAGRGTDIRLGPGVPELGGLHVIMSERHEAGRIDRQLAGRCGRQGEPGCFQAILSLEDPLLEMDELGVIRRAVGILQPWLGAWLGRLALHWAQRRAERLHAGMRRDLLATDELLGDALAFSGEPE